MIWCRTKLVMFHYWNRFLIPLLIQIFTWNWWNNNFKQEIIIIIFKICTGPGTRVKRCNILSVVGRRFVFSTAVKKWVVKLFELIPSPPRGWAVSSENRSRWKHAKKQLVLSRLRISIRSWWSNCDNYSAEMMKYFHGRTVVSVTTGTERIQWNEGALFNSRCLKLSLKGTVMVRFSRSIKCYSFWSWLDIFF